MPKTFRTTCPYCGVGCGVLATRHDDGRLEVRGDPEHPANRGRLCSKGTALPDTTGHDRRLLHPEIDGRRVDWETAIKAVADRFSATVAEFGPDSVALYLSGQILTEDYYVANKLMKGFVGTANVDTNSRLCMASTVVGHRRAFGSDTVPGNYTDLEAADLVVLVGSNLAWCHPVLHQRLQAARQQRDIRVVTIDPRRTVTADEGDLHLALRPGSDVSLFNGLLTELSRRGAVDREFLAAHTQGSADALGAAAADAPNAAAAALACGLSLADVQNFYDLFATTERVVTVFSQGVNQSASGTDAVNAILNIHLLTGRIGKPGMGPFSVTGQPNAMGGREVGGLANQLAAHMFFDAPSVDRVGRFWNAARMADKEGLKAVDMFRAIDDGRIKAVWIMGTNPAVSLPEADPVRRALGKCPTVVVSDVEDDSDTLRLAHIKLPAAAWSEKDGTVTNSDRTISRQRGFAPAPGEARPDWLIITQVARAMGFSDAFNYRRPADVFREHAALSAFENHGTRDFDIGATADLTDAEYDALQPFKWPYVQGGRPTPRLFGDGRFYTPDGKARLVPVRQAAPATPVSDAYPFILNTGRIRDQWHTMTRTGRSPRLSSHAPEPFVALHPADAARLEIVEGDLVRLSSMQGAATARAQITDAQRPGEVFLPMHWTDLFASDCVSGKLIAGVTDRFSGQPDSKRMAVQVEKATQSWTGLMLSREIFTPGHGGYWSRRAADGCHVYTLAGEDEAPVIQDFDVLFPALAQFEHVDYVDAARGAARRAWFDGGRLVACLFIARGGALPDPAWLTQIMAAAEVGGTERLAVLSGRAPAGVVDQGRTVCACFRVGVHRIVAAIRDQGLTTVAEITAAVQAGGGCGACVPELKGLLQNARQHHAVA
jgi:assimilatory nitrate reductase catalytic subunit